MKKVTRLSAQEAKNSVGKTNWQKLKSMSDAEIKAAAAADPDARLFQPQELRGFKRGPLSLPAKTSK